MGPGVGHGKRKGDIVMKKVILEEQDLRVVYINNVLEEHPVFAKLHNEFIGMIVKEDRGWILKTGGDCGAYGHYDTLRKCLEKGVEGGYTFYVED